MTELTGKQRRYLRGLGNRTRATVYLGARGINEALLGAIEEAFHTSELIKIKLQEGFPGERKETGALLAQKTGAHLVQVLGKTILLYRRDEESPEIELPGE